VDAVSRGGEGRRLRDHRRPCTRRELLKWSAKCTCSPRHTARFHAKSESEHIPPAPPTLLERTIRHFKPPPPAGLLDGNKRSTEAALKFFQDEFPRDTPLIIVSPDRDVLAPRPTLQRLFTVAAQARKVRGRRHRRTGGALALVGCMFAWQQRGELYVENRRVEAPWLDVP
jgi:hypothetical protein